MPRVQGQVRGTISRRPSKFRRRLRVLSVRGKGGKLTLFRAARRVASEDNVISTSHLCTTTTSFTRSLTKRIFAPIRIKGVGCGRPINDNRRLILGKGVTLVGMGEGCVCVDFFGETTRIFHTGFVVRMSGANKRRLRKWGDDEYCKKKFHSS